MRGQEEAKNGQLSVLRNAFHESPTREAFSSFAAQIHGMNQFVESTAEKLSVLTRRTEPFSPSKRSSQPITTCNSSNYHPPSSHNLFPPALPATSLSVSPPPGPTCSSSLQSAPLNSPTSGPLPLDPQPPAQSAQIVTSNGAQVYPPTSGFPQPTTTVLSPTTISVSKHHIYHVLPLSPIATTLGQPLIHTSHDLVLPSASAFSSSTYPVFTTVDCTWQYILDRVVNPSPLWASYSPGSLGDYADIKSIWQAWDEGEYIKDVGRKPALRLIDARWGNLESQETHKRKYPSWRPRNDNKVCARVDAFFTGILPVGRHAKCGRIFISLFIALTRESSPEIALAKQSSTSKIWEEQKAWASSIRSCSPRKGNGEWTSTTTSFNLTFPLALDWVSSDLPYYSYYLLLLLSVFLTTLPLAS